MKVCKKCREVKEPKEFYVCKSNRDGKHGSCKKCFCKLVKEHQQIPEVKAHRKTQGEKYREIPEVKAQIKAHDKERGKAPERKAKKKAQAQTSEAKIWKKKYAQTPEAKAQAKTHNQLPGVKARRNERRKERRGSDLDYRIAENLRSRGWDAIVNDRKAGSFVRDLGCSLDEFRVYLESHFNPGMTWDNYGNGPGKWNLDHITPLSAFDLGNREQFQSAAHYSNYQPLWWEENLLKGDRF
jgi:hypothetical protein